MDSPSITTTPPTVHSEPYDYCAWRTRQSGSSFYSSFFILPFHQRRGMMALYAFCREVDDIVDEVDERQTPQVAQQMAENQLLAWKNCLSRLEQAKGDSAAWSGEHPVAQALADTAERFSLPYADLQLIVQGMAMDLSFVPYSSWNDLFVYCDRVAGVVGRLSARIFGFSPENEAAIMQYATSLGRALQLVNILRDGLEDSERGRIYIPRSLWQNNFSWETFQQNNESGKKLDEKDWRAFYSPVMVEAFFQHIDTAFSEAVANLPKIEQSRQRAGIVMGRVYFSLYRTMRDAYRVNADEACKRLAKSAIRLPSRQKWWIMLSTLIFRRGLHE